MKTVLVACKTIEEEINHALKNFGDKKIDTIWISSELHNTPERLHYAIQEKLDEIKSANQVLLGFGTCGRAVLNLKAGNFTLVLPKVDDCITLLLGSVEERRKNETCRRIYYLTKGWMQNPQNIYEEYKYSRKKYGESLTREIYEELLSHYDNLGIVCTEAYDCNALIEETRIVATTLGLSQIQVCGTLKYVEKLLAGPWNEEEFIVVPKYAAVTVEMLDSFQT